jgi:hypothetical protein
MDGAENLYQGAPVAGRLPESNRARGEHIAVYFGEDRIERATVTGRPSGEYRFELAAADSARAAEETVRYEGGRIDYLVQERRIRIRDSAKLHYQDLELGAGRVDFDSRKQTLIARDRPVLKEKEEEVSGRAMTYDLDKGRGTVFHAATQYDHGYYSGAAIERTGDNVLQVRGASYSTCDLAEPHYHVAAGRMKIILHDKIIARPLVFYIKNIPLMAFPFYVMPIRSERHSGLLFPQTQIGFNSQGGRFLRNLGYYWAPNDYMDLTLSGDYYEAEPLWVARGEGRYRYLDRVTGEFDVRYTASNAFLGQRQYDVNFTHNQTLDSRTRLTAQGNFTSSREFQRGDITGQPLADRVNRFLVSSVVLNRRLSFGSLNAYFDRRQDLDAEPGVIALPKLTEDLPIVSLALFQRAIGHAATGPHSAFLPWLASTYYNLTVRAVNQHSVSTVFTVDTTLVDSVLTFTPGQRDISTRLGVVAAQGGLSDNRRILGFLNVSPNFNFSTAFFSKDALGRTWSGAGVYNLGIGTSTTLYGTFHPNLAGVRGIRHILFPQVAYVYQPDFPGLTYKDANGFTQNRFPSVGGVSLGGQRQSLLNYSLQQRLQMRLQFGDKKIDLSNLLSVVSSGTYDFLWHQHGLPNAWRPLNTTFRLQPPRFFSFSGSFTHSFDRKPYWRTFTFFADLRLSGSGSSPAVGELPLDNNEALSRGDALAKGPWSLSLTYSYTRGRNLLGGWDVSQAANSYLSLSPTPKWHLTYYNTVNLDRHRIEAQEYAVERDLHCWQARFVRRFTADNSSEYYFRIAIVQQPEVNIGLGSRGLGSFSGY